MDTAINELSEREVLGVLTQVSADAREALSDAEASTIINIGDAREALAALLMQQSVGGPPTERILEAGGAESRIARDLLRLLLADPATAAATADALASPPPDAQKSVEVAAHAAIVLGALIAWLQMSVEIKVARKAEGVEFSFRMKKGATGEKTLSQIARAVSRLIS